MSVEVEASVWIDRSPQLVFEYLSNFENNPLWQKGMREAQFSTEGPLGVGSQYEQVAGFLGSKIVSRFEVIEYEPGRLVRIRTIEGSFPIDVTRTVQAEGGGSRVKAMIRGDATGFFRLPGRLLRPLVRRSVERDYARLKEVLEAGSTP